MVLQTFYNPALKMLQAFPLVQRLVATIKSMLPQRFSKPKTQDESVSDKVTDGQNDLANLVSIVAVGVLFGTCCPMLLLFLSVLPAAVLLSYELIDMLSDSAVATTSPTVLSRSLSTKAKSIIDTERCRFSIQLAEQIKVQLSPKSVWRVNQRGMWTVSLLVFLDLGFGIVSFCALVAMVAYTSFIASSWCRGHLESPDGSVDIQMNPMAKEKEVLWSRPHARSHGSNAEDAACSHSSQSEKIEKESQTAHVSPLQRQVHLNWKAKQEPTD